MIVQLVICLIFVVAYNLFAENVKSGNMSLTRAKNMFILFACVVMILQSALRNVAVGTDTYAYYRSYLQYADCDWSYLLNRMRFLYDGDVTEKDPGFAIICKLVSLVSGNYRFFLFFIATMFFGSLGLLMKLFCRNSRDVFIAVLIYQVLFYGFFSVTGLRQTIAVALFFYGCKFFLLKRDLLPYVLLCILASTIHKSALICIPLYFVAYIKNPIKFLTIVLVVSPFIFIMLRPFAGILTSFTVTESYSVYTNSSYETQGAIMYYVFMLIVSLMILLSRKSYANMSQNTRVAFNAFPLGVLFMPLSWIDPSLVRVAMYFSVFSMFIFGEVIDKTAAAIHVRRSFIYLFTLLVFCFTIIKRDSAYDFFWNEMPLESNYHISISTKGI